MRDVARQAWADAAARLETGEWANASSLHAAGRATRAAVEDARERIAAALGAHPTEVIFTSGATEANNFAIKGLFWSRTAGAGDARSTHGSGALAIVTTAVEHHAALDPARWLAGGQGVELVELPVDAQARVDLTGLPDALTGAALISVQWVNNEVGTIQPIAKIAEAALEAGVPMHSDAAQAVAHLLIDFAKSGLTTMAVSAHKLGGPVGVGALLARRDARLTPLTHGGGQERRIRSGTLDVAGARAFAAALEEAVGGRETESARLEGLREHLVQGIAALIPDAMVSGPGTPVSGKAAVVSQPDAGRSGPATPTERTPHIVHLVIPGASSEALLYLFDDRGIAVSSGSACTAGVVDASHVALAMGRSAVEASQTLRLSLGHTSTAADVEEFLAALVPVVERARATLR